MNLHIFKNAQDASQAVYEQYRDRLEKGAHVLGLATGSTPEGLYELLSQSDLDFSDLYSINLDEYYGLASDHPQSYAYFMNQHLFRHKPFKASFLPNGLAQDIEAELERYNQIIQNHPIDLQLLGVGNNGHIGFNEPGTPKDSLTHYVQLTEETIDANQRFFNHRDEVPSTAISMGIASILSAKEIIVMAFGPQKAWAIAQAFEGPVSEQVPLSFLQTHPRVTFYLDQAAASQLSRELRQAHPLEGGESLS